MIEDLGRHKSTKFTREEKSVDKALRSPFFDNLEEIGRAYDIKELKRNVKIKRTYQCGLLCINCQSCKCYNFIMIFWTSISVDKILNCVI